MDRRILAAIRDLEPAHAGLAASLSEKWGENLYPCDVMAFAVLNRSLDVLSGFLVTSQRLYYSSSVCLLRVQLDSVTRFNGIITAADPHDLANRVFAGEQLRRIKGDDGCKLTDQYLVAKLSAKNPWVQEAYDLACAHVHLSEEHIKAFLHRSPDAGEGAREVTIGASARHLSAEAHNNLASAFYSVTCGVIRIVEQWAEVRPLRHLELPPENRFRASI